MDRAGDWIPSLSAPPSGTIDLHLHSTASDGKVPPGRVVERAASAGLGAIALTDHDTVSGIPEAMDAGERTGVRVVGGCEFSVAAPWGEMHVLGYFLPHDNPVLESFLERCRTDRRRRAEEMVQQLQLLGVDLSFESVLRESAGGSLGRPHVARALVRHGGAADLTEAFDRFLGRGKPAFVEKALPTFAAVVEVVHGVGGLVSAAHLKDRGSRDFASRLKEEGLDAVETRHPSHDSDRRAYLTNVALDLGLLRTGGSDWHGDPEPGSAQSGMGSQQVPMEWLNQLDDYRDKISSPLPL